MAMLIHLCIPCSWFCARRAELSSCSRDPAACSIQDVLAEREQMPETLGATELSIDFLYVHSCTNKTQ